jgi:TetR/AcrR family transcriptional regulator, transcriptional repressor for nem operon
MGKGDETRTRILDAAQASVTAKGFGATSIEELIAETGITKSGFFYHFRDKTELAKALLRRFLEEDEWVFDAVFARARDLVDDPLQVFLVGAALPRRPDGGHAAGASRLPRRRVLLLRAALRPRVQEINREGALRWRSRFRAHFEEIAAVHPPREPMDADDFADMVSTVLEGGIVMAKALGDPAVLPRQILVLRTFVKLLFAPPRPA